MTFFFSNKGFEHLFSTRFYELVSIHFWKKVGDALVFEISACTSMGASCLGFSILLGFLCAFFIIISRLLFIFSYYVLRLLIIFSYYVLRYVRVVFMSIPYLSGALLITICEFANLL